LDLHWSGISSDRPDQFSVHDGATRVSRVTNLVAARACSADKLVLHRVDLVLL
jgi:hypothetical protein